MKIIKHKYLFANNFKAKWDGLQGDKIGSALLATLQSTGQCPAFGNDPAPLMPEFIWQFCSDMLLSMSVLWET